MFKIDVSPSNLEVYQKKFTNVAKSFLFKLPFLQYAQDTGTNTRENFWQFKSNKYSGLKIYEKWFLLEITP